VPRQEPQAGLRLHEIAAEEAEPAQALPDGTGMIKLLLFAILFVIAWPLALIIALGWLALLILRVCFGLTVLGLKAAAARGIGAGMAGSLLARTARTTSLRDYNERLPWSPTSNR
jgi:hypothetical protein